jgi:adenylate cyclase
MALTNDPIASESAERLLVVDLHDGKDAAMSSPDDSSVAHVDRRLAAILSADVKEYSRLMGADDVGTVDMLTTYRTAISALISEHRGRVVDSAGDSLLAEFSSVVDAVQCSVGIQEELNGRNADLSAERRMDFRVGVNLGEVIVEGDRIYGDGVNVAACVQALAEGGGVCISGSVCDEISGKLSFDCEPLGEHTLKNIDEAVRVYRVRASTRPEAVPSSHSAETHPGLGSSENPSVAVLPFASMSDDPEQEHFTDGITEDIITNLSKVGGLAVIARTSVFTYKNRAVKIPDLGRELGVRYVVEGSVRKVDGQVRITAQLVDAVAGHHLWAERYDRDVNDIFGVQDEISHRIVIALKEILTAEK